MPSGIFLDEDTYNQLGADTFAKRANAEVADQWAQRAMSEVPDVLHQAQQTQQQAHQQAADAFAQRATSDLASIAPGGGYDPSSMAAPTTPDPQPAPDSAPPSAVPPAAAPVSPDMTAGVPTPDVAAGATPFPAEPAPQAPPAVSSPTAPITAPMTDPTSSQQPLPRSAPDQPSSSDPFQKALDWGTAQIGKPYIWGSAGGRSDLSGNAPGYDCSGFVAQFYHQMGRSVPAQTSAAYSATTHLDAKDARPGDLVQFNMDTNDPHEQHIAIYLGNGKILQSGGGSVAGVNIGDINGPGDGKYEFRRAAGGPPSINSDARAAVGSVASDVPTTAGISGGGDLAGKIGQAGQQILSKAADTVSWLGDQGTKALQAVLVTEGGLSGARGDNGKSAGPLQFFEGGQLAAYARQTGQSLEQAKTAVERDPVGAIQWAIGTPDKPGYLGRVIADGISKGLSGPDLATYAQQHGQVSVSPERAGQNYRALFGADGSGSPVMGGPTSTSMQTAQSSPSAALSTQPASLSDWLVQREQAGQGDPSDAELSAFLTAHPNSPVPQPTPSNPLDWLGSVKDKVGGALGGLLGQNNASPVPAPGNGYDPSSLTARAAPTDPGIPLRPVGAALPSGGPTVGDAIGPAVQDFAQNGPIGAQNAALRAAGQTGAVQTVANMIAPYLLHPEQADEVARVLSGGGTRDELAQLGPMVGGTEMGGAGQDVGKALTGQTGNWLSNGVRRFFHGTGGDFPKPDAAKFDPNGLFGPGYYMTDNPTVAGGLGDTVSGTGYAVSEMPHVPTPDEIGAWQAAQAKVGRLERELARPDNSPAIRAELQGMLDSAKGLVDYYAPPEWPNAGPNVRAIDVPQNLNLLDAESPIGLDAADTLSKITRGKIDFQPDDTGLIARNQIEDYLTSAGFSPANASTETNNLLANAGFDGIQYSGGKRIPMQDANGQAIEHTAINVFPQSIDKLRNAVSGTAGGSANPQFATSLGGAAAGGGGTYLATDPNDPNRWEKVGAATLAGAALPYAVPKLGEAAMGAADRIKPPSDAFASTVKDELGHTINPFQLATEPGPNRTLLAPEGIATHYETLAAQYEANHARISELETRLESASGKTGKGDFTGGVIRPPWAPGWSDEALSAFAKDNGFNPTQAGWFDRVDPQIIAESGFKGTGTNKQTPTQIRQELAQLRANNELIDAAASHMLEHDGQSLYRNDAPLTEDLPFAEYNPNHAAVGTDENAAAASAGRGARDQGNAPQSVDAAPPARATDASPPAEVTPRAVPPDSGSVFDGPATRQPGQLGLDIGEQYQADLNPPSSGNFEAPGPADNTWWKRAEANQFRASMPPLNPDMQGITASKSVGPQDVLPGFPSPSGNAGPAQIFRAYHTANVVSGLPTITHVAVNSIMAPAWSGVTRTAADVVTRRPDRIAGRGIGVSTALSTSGDAFASAMRDFFSDSHQVFNRIDNPVLSGTLRAQSIPTSLHAAFQSLARNAIEHMELGATAGEQAAKEGLSGSQFASRVAELINDPSQLADRSARAADVAMRGSLRAPAGSTQETMQRIAAVPYVGNTLFPVVRIAAQSLAQGIEKSPIGLVGTLFDVGRASIGHSGPYAGPGGYKALGGAVTPLSDRLVNNIAGTALTAWLAQKAMDGSITGNGPADPAQLKELQAAGWQAHSIYVPGRGYTDYHIMGALAVPLALAGNYADAVNYAKPDASADDFGKATSIAGDIAHRTASYLGDSTGLRTLGDLYTIIHGGQGADRVLASFAGSTVAGFVPESALLKSATVAADSGPARSVSMKDVPTAIAQTVEQGIPGLRQNVPIKQDVLGRSVPNEQAGAGIFLPRSGSGEPNAAIRLLLNSAVSLGNPPTTITLGGAHLDLTANEQQQFQTFRGDYLLKVAPQLEADHSFMTAPIEVRQKVLREQITVADEQARARVLGIMGNSAINSRVTAGPRESTTARVPITMPSR